MDKEMRAHWKTLSTVTGRDLGQEKLQAKRAATCEGHSSTHQLASKAGTVHQPLVPQVQPRKCPALTFPFSESQGARH